MVKKRVAYSVDTKNKAVEMKLRGYSTKQIMHALNIKNETQVETWFRWYKNGETHRFHQQIGKQYSYEKGMAELSEIDQLKLELKRKEVELEILKIVLVEKSSTSTNTILQRASTYISFSPVKLLYLDTLRSFNHSIC